MQQAENGQSEVGAAATGRIAFTPATMGLMQCKKVMLPSGTVVSKAETSSAETEVMFDMGRWGCRWKSRQMLGRML